MKVEHTRKEAEKLINNISAAILTRDVTKLTNKSRAWILFNHPLKTLQEEELSFRFERGERVLKKYSDLFNTYYANDGVLSFICSDLCINHSVSLLNHYAERNAASKLDIDYLLFRIHIIQSVRVKINLKNYRCKYLRIERCWLKRGGLRYSKHQTSYFALNETEAAKIWRNGYRDRFFKDGSIYEVSILKKTRYMGDALYRISPSSGNRFIYNDLIKPYEFKS